MSFLVIKSITPFTGEITQQDTQAPLIFTQGPRKGASKGMHSHLVEPILGASKLT